MSSITIDTTKFRARYSRQPGDEEIARWTFYIDEEPVVLYGKYAEAVAKAKFYVRLYDIESGIVELSDFSPAGSVYAILN